MGKKIAVVMLILIFSAVSLTACGKPLKDDPIVGKWKLSELTYSGEQKSDNLIDASKNGDVPMFDIDEDGTCTFMFMEHSGTGTVEKTKDGYTLSDKSGSMPIDIVDGSLFINYSKTDTQMYFSPIL